MICLDCRAPSSFINGDHPTLFTWAELTGVAVPNADNNSDHPQRRGAPREGRVAVALSYCWSADEAPRVVATGRGYLAEAILDRAFSEGVQVREDPDLAALLGSLDVGQEIPVEAFAAVAEILHYLYLVNGGPAGTGAGSP